MTDIAIGIDIGGTNTVIGLIDRLGHCYYKQSFPSITNRGEDFFVDLLCSNIEMIMQKSEHKNLHLKAVGIGAPNGNYFTGSIEFAPNLQFKDIVPLTEMVNERIHLPVFLTNDANAAAIGEHLYGAAKGYNDFIMITLGTGVGSGIYTNGRLLYGHDAFAGELGHTTAVENGRQCNCGRKGCLETYCSATGIKRTAFQLMADTTMPSPLRDIPFCNMKSKDIFFEAQKGDTMAIEAFRITAEILGKQLANAVAFSSPNLIVLFGGLTNAGALLFSPLKKYFEESLLKIYKNKISIVPSQLDEDNAAIVGAAAVAWEQILNS